MPSNKSCRTQINLEFLKNPHYRLYIYSNNVKEINKLENYLKNHKSVYSVSLGISECLANFKYKGSFRIQSKNKETNDFIEISSIVPFYFIKEKTKINFLKEDRKYIKIHMPIEMKQNRELIKSGDFLIEVNGKTISVKNLEYSYIPKLKENILFF